VLTCPGILTEWDDTASFPDLGIMGNYSAAVDVIISKHISRIIFSHPLINQGSWVRVVLAERLRGFKNNQILINKKLLKNGRSQIFV
jgi:hypothetical protein